MLRLKKNVICLKLRSVKMSETIILIKCEHCGRLQQEFANSDNYKLGKKKCNKCKRIIKLTRKNILRRLTK